MKRALAAAVAGLVFGYGLSVSGMVDRHVVLGFLDVAGDWDPTLVFVLLAAVCVALAGFRLVLRRSRPVLADGFHLPTRKAIDGPLIIGAAVFGVGWGLSGYCPGPGIAASALGVSNALLFLGSMLVGILVHRLGTRVTVAPGPAPADPSRGGSTPSTGSP